MSLQFPNGQTAKLAMMGRFTIYRPTIWLEPLTDDEQNRFYTISYANPLTCKLKLGANDDTGDGTMRFTVDVKSQYSGALYLTQLIRANYSNPAYDFAVERCDGTEFYSGPNPVKAGNYDKNGLISMDDGPNSIWVSANRVSLYSCRDFVRFQPDGGIPVTLGIVRWHTLGIAEELVPGIDWFITTDDTPPPQGPDSSDEWPLWKVNQGGMH
jgi:hypothetical protein